MTISACTFCYNEAHRIEASLRSMVGWVDEIIIFDLESTDETRNIARHFTDKVFLRPYLLVGDGYKLELATYSKGDWLLWFYPDEVFSPLAGSIIKKLVEIEKYNVFQFMRREFMDGVRCGYNGPDGSAKTIQFGTPECPNYQTRLIKKTPELFYTELVHAEVFGDVHACAAPPECYMEHHKSSQDQEFDNIRLYISYHYLAFKYGNTQVEPYKTFVDSYRKIIHDSETKNLTGERKISLMEEFWFCWRKYADMGRVTLDEFRELTGITYKEFLRYTDKDLGRKIVVEGIIQDKILDGKLEQV